MAPSSSGADSAASQSSIGHLRLWAKHSAAAPVGAKGQRGKGARAVSSRVGMLKMGQGGLPGAEQGVRLA